MEDDEIKRKIVQEAREREGTLCPSYVARQLSEDWRPLMDRIHEQVKELAKEGKIEVLKQGEPIDPEELKGPYRISES